MGTKIVHNIMESNSRKYLWLKSSCPDEIISDTLARLPVKSLLRFQCVSKHWFGLIKSPSFVSDHLGHSRLKQLAAIRTFLQDPKLTFRISFLLADESFLDGCTLFSEQNDFSTIFLPSSEVVGSCNGLILLAASTNSLCDSSIL